MKHSIPMPSQRDFTMDLPYGVSVSISTDANGWIEYHPICYTSSIYQGVGCVNQKSFRGFDAARVILVSAEIWPSPHTR
jgi:hypothetical protein